ncbi:MAG: hypothetical protein Q7J76_06810 [Candidatus Brocadiaceae bacterium]|nr:hypothetical protein [Candidatus Brocadiaceae bacterium]
MKSNIRYKHVLLKISGEGFGSENGRGIETENFIVLAKEIQKVSATGVELAIVVGGGNIPPWRKVRQRWQVQGTG